MERSPIFGLFPSGTSKRGEVKGARMLGWIVVAAMVSLVTSAPEMAWAMGAKPKEPVRHESLMVRFEDGVSESRINEIWAAEKIENVAFLSNLGFFIVRLPEGLDAAVLVERLKKYTEVRYVEIDARAAPLEEK